MPKTTRQKPEPPTRPKRNAKGPGRREGTVAGSGPEISPENRQRARERLLRRQREAREAQKTGTWWSWWFDDDERSERSDGEKEKEKKAKDE